MFISKTNCWWESEFGTVVNVTGVMVAVSMVGGVWQWCSPVGLEVPYVYAFVRHCLGPQARPLEDPSWLLLSLPSACPDCSIISSCRLGPAFCIFSPTNCTWGEAAVALKLHTLTACHTYCVTQCWKKPTLGLLYMCFIYWTHRIQLRTIKKIGK